MTAIVPSAFVIGPARIFYRACGVLTPWTDVGVTLDDAVLRVTQTMFNPDNLNGVFGPVRGLDVAQMTSAEIEFTLGEISGAKMALAIPGATFTAADATNMVSTPFSSTSTAASLAGATSIPATATTNLVVGDYISIDTSTVKEYRQVTSITALVIGWRDPLLFAHASGVALVETNSDNRSIVTMPTTRRQPAAAYNEWALTSESGKSGVNELRLPIGIARSAGEVTVSDSAVAGMRVIIAGRLDETSLETSMYKLFSPA